MFNTRDEAVVWITDRRQGSRGLSAFCDVMSKLGNIQDRIPSIHVAGTNGKGSTCEFMKECLMAAGYKVGTFTSPHLIQHQDRIRINGKWIDDKSFVRILNQYYSVLVEYDLNMFEIDFLIACQYFIDMDVDIMIIEVGLGGRLDCTNCLTHPFVSVITTIGLDHTELLGDTLEKIAFEKAGIIKKESVCVIGCVKENVFRVLSDVASNQNTVCIRVDESQSVGDSQFLYKQEQFKIKTKAKYQMRNATLALTVLDDLLSRGKIKISRTEMKQGIENSLWEGRFEVVSQDPLIIVDGAHNTEGIEALCEAVQCCPHPWVFVFAALKDKPAKEMVRKIQSIADTVIVTQFDFYRNLDAKELRIDDTIIQIDNMIQAIERGKASVKEKGTLILCGSLYFISEVRKLFQKGGSNE